MRRISLFLYTVKQGIKNIRRNKKFSFASIGTITACLFLVGIFYFVISNFQHMVKNLETSVGISVFFEEGISEEEIKQLGDQIASRSEVKEIRYISSEEAWKRFQEMFQEEEDLLESYIDVNPLEDSSSYEVYANDLSQQKVLVSYIKKLEGVRKVNSLDSVAIGLSSFDSLVGYVSMGIIIILIAVAVFLIHTMVTMGITVRQEEIAIMKLIGATDYLIRAPFIVEGTIIGLVGAGIPLVVLQFLYDQMITFLSERYFSMFDLFGSFRFLAKSEVFSVLAPLSLGIGIGIGLIGSYITVRKHLNK